MKHDIGNARSRLLWRTGLAGLLILMPLVMAQVRATQDLTERTLESLSVCDETFHNVKVIQQTPTDILFRHDGGITGFKVQYLDNPTLRRLGYEIAEAPPKASEVASERFETLSNLVPAGDFRWGLLLLSTALVALVVGACIYTGYVFRMICLKSGTRPGFAVWLPLLQAFPLLRAARMSWAWLLALVSLSALLVYAAFRVPEHTMVFGVLLTVAFLGLASVWAVRICHACGKNSLFAVFLLLPGLNCLALVYLASPE